MNQPTEGRVLLVGEGNFSLSASLVEGGTISGPQLIATCIETFTAVQETHQLASSNIEFLEKAGGTVLFEVDATDLHNHPDINFFQFERVIFNFPLADRHNIKKNRALLSDFFSSVKNILDSERGQVMVTLCKGQGGTPADQPMRSWHDSWQVVSMAANAGFILMSVYPFAADDFSRYKSVGFRFQDKSFNTDNALTHVFEMARGVTVPDLDTSRTFLQQGEEHFVVPPYIRRKHDKWSLLEKKNHPLSSLHNHFVSHLAYAFPTLSILPSNHPHLPRVLPGYRSSLLITSTENEDVAEDADVMATEEDGPELPLGSGDIGSSLPTGKDLKDLKNMEKVAASLEGTIVGVKDGSGDAAMVSQTSGEKSSPQAQQNVFKHGVEREGPAAVSETRKPAKTAAVFPPTESPVYVVHKLSPPKPDGLSGASKLSDDVKDPREGEDDVLGCGKEEEAMETAADEEDTVGGKDSENGARDADTSPVPGPPPVDTLFHLRCSLLENLPHLKDYMAARSAVAALMSGIVFRKCPVGLYELPTSHETVVLAHSESETVDDLGNQLCAALRAVVDKESVSKVKVVCSSRCLNIGDERYTVALTLSEATENPAVFGHVFRLDTGENTDSHKNEGILKSVSRSLIGAVLYLENIACRALRLPDVRLLWSEDERFIGQFSTPGTSPLQRFSFFTPFSLYPVRFVHDISFWENPDRMFDEAELLDVVREVADDAVTCVTLVDRYDSTEEGKTSRCYRLVFQSHDRVLSYITSWKLQSVLRLKVAHHLGVTLR